MAGERAIDEEPCLWHFKPGTTPDDSVKGKTFIRARESTFGNIEKVLGITVGAVATLDEIPAASLANTIGSGASILLIQRRLAIAKDDPEYQRLIEMAAATVDKAEASDLRTLAGRYADVMLVEAVVQTSIEGGA